MNSKIFLKTWAEISNIKRIDDSFDDNGIFVMPKDSFYQLYFVGLYNQENKKAEEINQNKEVYPVCKNECKCEGEK